MTNLTLTLEEEVIILDKYNLTSNELFMLRALLILQNDGNEDLLLKYMKSLHDCEIPPRKVLLSLQDKQIILKTFKIPEEGVSFSPYEIPLNKTFVKNLYKSSFELGKELFEQYPMFATINGNCVSIRSVSKHFNSLEDAYRKYGQNIKWNPEKHQHILELIEWSKEHNILNQSLSSFIINHTWESLEALKNGDRSDINYDAIKLV